MADLKAELDLEINKFRSQVKRAQNIARGMERNAQRTGRRMGPAMFGGIASAARAAAGKVSGAFNQIIIGGLRNIGAQITNQLANAVRAGLGGAVAQGVQQESVEMSFSSLSADGAGGSRIFEELRKDALRTGVEVSAMFGTVRKLMAQGMDEGTSLELSDSLLDIGGNLGLGSEDINRIGLAISQIVGKGKAMAEEITQQLGERGIPIIAALKEVRGETGAELFKSMEQGKISAQQVVDIFRNMEGPFEKFKGGADRMASTMGGLIARFRREIQDLQLVIGQKLIPYLKPPLEWAIGKIQEMKIRVVEIMDYLDAAVRALDFATVADIFKQSMEIAWKSIINIAWRGLMGIASSVPQMMFEGFQNSLSLLREITKPNFWKGLGDVLTGIFAAAMASLLQPLASEGGIMGKKAKQWQENLRGTSDAAFDRAKNPNGAVMNTIDSVKKAALARMKNMLEDLSKSFADGYGGTNDIFDIGAQKDALKKQIAALKKEIETNITPSALTPPKPGSPAAPGKKAAALATAAGSGTPGGFFSEIAAIKGQTLEQALAAQGKQQIDLLGKIVNNTTPKEAPRGPINPVTDPVFGA